MLVLALDSSRKTRDWGSSDAHWRAQLLRACAMSARSCSAARSVFFYMSGSSLPARNGLRATCSADPKPNAVPEASGRAACPATASSGCGAQQESRACVRRSGVVGVDLLCVAAVAGASSPCPPRPGSVRQYPVAYPPWRRKTQGSVRASPARVSSCTDTITDPATRLQYYLIRSSRNPQASRNYLIPFAELDARNSNGIVPALSRAGSAAQLNPSEFCGSKPRATRLFF